MKVSSIVLNNFTNDSRVEKQAISLSQAGFDLTVFGLWKMGLKSHEVKTGYKIERIKLQTISLRGRLGRLLKFIEYSFRVAWRIKNGVIIHCHDYHPLPAMLLAKLFFRSKSYVIYDAHEFESQKLGLNKISKFVIINLEKISSRFIDGFITVSGSILEIYNELFLKIPKTLILNCPIHEVLEDSNKFDISLSLLKGSVKCLYQGAFIPYRGISELLDISNDLQFKHVNFIFMGYGGKSSVGQKLEEEIIERSIKLKNVHFVPTVPREDLLSYTSSASFGVCLTIDNCLNHRYSLPNKFFEYAMAGLPLLVSNLSELRTLVEKYECGVICESVTPEGIKKGIIKLLSMDLEKLGANARKMAKENSWEVQEKKLLSLYDEVLNRPSKRNYFQ